MDFPQVIAGPDWPFGHPFQKGRCDFLLFWAETQIVACSEYSQSVKIRDIFRDG